MSSYRSSSSRARLTVLADNAVCFNCRPRTAELHAKQVSLSPFHLAPQSAHTRLSSSKSRLEPRRLSRDCGRNASVARAPCTRFVSPRSRASPPLTLAIQDVLCTSKDCPIFYMRKKAQKDVADSVTQLERCEFLPASTFTSEGLTRSQLMEVGRVLSGIFRSYCKTCIRWHRVCTTSFSKLPPSFTSPSPRSPPSQSPIPPAPPSPPPSTSALSPRASP